MTGLADITYSTIVSVLNQELKPVYLEVIDESHRHKRSTPENPATHFKVIVVSEVFTGLSRIRRHQLVYSTLSELFKNGLHSLTQTTFTPDEWSKNPKVGRSPNCAGAVSKG